MKKCEVCSKEDKRCSYSSILRKMLCSRHYQQVKRYGNIKRTTRDSNEIVVFNDYAEVILCNKIGDEVARTKIDKDDIDKIKDYRWCVHSKEGYVSTTLLGTRQKLFIHQVVMGNTSSEIDIDHISGNTLDNRKSNLRICTHQENMINVRTPSSNKSGHKGVFWDKTTNKWDASITVNKVQMFLGAYDNKLDAIGVREEAEIKYFGEFRYKGTPMPVNVTEVNNEVNV